MWQKNTIETYVFEQAELRRGKSGSGAGAGKGRRRRRIREEHGSYPILELYQDGVSVRREGPGLSHLLRQVRHAITVDRYAA